jgi:hypothetical protein
VDLPQVTSIGVEAFYGCTSLATMNLPLIANIGEWAFKATGTQTLNITLGASAPNLGRNLFHQMMVDKTVNVYVPSDAPPKPYGTRPINFIGAAKAQTYWGDGFRGKGWTNQSYSEDKGVYVIPQLNTNVTLYIRDIEP